VTHADPHNTVNLGAPLAGRSVLVTRTAEQAHALVDPLTALGAEVLVMPVLETVDPDDWGPVDDAIRALDTYDWLVFTSTNSVDRFLRRFRPAGGSRDALLGIRIAAVGSATANRLAHHGLPPVLVPDDFRAEGLIAEFRAMGPDECRRVLLPRALEAREVFADALTEMGCVLDVVTVYRVQAARPVPEVIERLRERTVDAVTFTSGAIASAFVTALDASGLDADEVMSGLTVASIGPVTTEALQALGYSADIEADESTMASLAVAVGLAFSQEEVRP